jgi:hypothetical protein
LNAVVIGALHTSDWLGPLATLTTGLIAAGLVIRQLSALKRRNEFDILGVIGGRMRERFAHVEHTDGEHPFYSLRRHVAHVPTGRATHKQNEYECGLADRVKVLSKLSEDEYREGLDLVEPVVNVLNEVAEAIDNRNVDHSKILARYHLLIIREVFIAEPFIVSEVVLGTRGRWGMRVVELGRLARKYNDMNPIHRRSVFFLRNRDADEAYGTIHEQPQTDGLHHVQLAWWTIRRHLFGYPRITERTKRRQNAMLRRLTDRLADLKVVQRPLASHDRAVGSTCVQGGALGTA